MNLVGIYDAVKALSFVEGYFLCHPIRSERGSITCTAIVVPAASEPGDFDLLCEGQVVNYEAEESIDGLSQTVLRLDMPSGGVKRIKFTIAFPKDKVGQISCRSRTTGKDIGCSYHLPPSGYQLGEGLSGQNMRRAGRSDDQLYHLFSGFDDSEKLKTIINGGGKIERPRRVLDWGVGSARVATHMRLAKNIEMYGVDIDPVNMSALLSSGYPSQNFKLMQPGGQIPFEDSTFDAVYGISVFTHLTEDLQFKYLEELSRVLIPGGVGIFSVHGLIHFFSRINDGTLFYKLMDKGFLVTGDNHDLSENFTESNTSKLYVDTLHAPNYIYERWSRFFSKIRMIWAPNAYGHDLVICQK
jgi:ubiquinone/menaquinone biosynthesis C-methylase UbiE